MKKKFVFILSVFATSWLLLCLIYPDLWLFHTRRLLVLHETMLPLESTYLLVSHAFQGGIQLWDRFDGMNNAYFVLSNGVYGTINVVTAFVFILLSPLWSHPGEALYHVHLTVFYGLCLLIRTLGGYALLCKFVTDRRVIFISLLYLNTILTSYMMQPGILTQALYSFLPLLLYYILCFFEELRLRRFLCCLLVMGLCFVSTPLFTLGYFYQVLHFFILSCLLFFVLRRGWHQLKTNQTLPRREWWVNMALLGCFFLMVLPYLWWGQALFHDFYVAGSGVGGTKGRFNNIFNLAGYFDVQGKSFTNPLAFLSTSLDYRHHVWGSSWLFLGATSLAFALIGLVLGRNYRKHLCWMTIVSIILINVACYPGNLSALVDFIKQGRLHPNDIFLGLLLSSSGLAHWINALTNPFSFLVRSFHMCTMLISMFLFPLVALGIDACLKWWQGRKNEIYAQRVWIVGVFFLGVFIYSLGHEPAAHLKGYLLAVAFFFIVFLALGRWGVNVGLAWAILAVLFIIDIKALMVYRDAYDKDPVNQTVPSKLLPSYTPQAVVPDFQNPEILSWREFMNVDPTVITPNIYSNQGMYGAFYQYAPLGRYFREWSIYEPRPLSYQNLFPDNEIQTYLEQNPRSLFLADYAFDWRYLSLADIMRAQVANRVVLVEPQPYNQAFLKAAERVHLLPRIEPSTVYHLMLRPQDAHVRHDEAGVLYMFHLPADFPGILSTTVFTADTMSWRLTVGDKLLSPVQGQLTAPYTFDVQNIQARTLSLRWPNGQSLGAVDLQVKWPQGIQSVFKNTDDNFGFVYQAPWSGWLVFHLPYDPKWEMTIDGKIVPLSKVNGYFIGTPLSLGEHKIELRYWPHTSLRWLVLISILVSLMCLGYIIYSLLLREPIHGL